MHPAKKETFIVGYCYRFLSLRGAKTITRATPSTRQRKLETWLGWLLPLSPAMELLAVVSLSSRARTVWAKVREHRTEMMIWGALAIVGLVSAMLGYDLVRGLTSWLIPFLFIWTYCLGRWGLTDPQQFLRSMLRGTALLATIIIIARWLQLEVRIGDFPVLTNFRGNGRGNVLGVVSNGLAVMLEAGVVGGIGLLFAGAKRRDKLEGLLIAVLCTVAIFITMSRGAMVGVAAGALAGAILFSPLALFPLATAGIAGVLLSPRLQRRVLSIIDVTDDRSNVTRLHIWEGTWRMLKDHFWLGVGPGNFSRVYPLYSTPGYEMARTPHNTYLNLISGWGFLGGLLFFGWIGWVMVRTFRRGLTPIQKTIFMILIAFWTHVLFDDLITVYAALLLGALENDALQKDVNEDDLQAAATTS